MFLLTLPLLGQAQITWTGATNRDWSTAANWSSNSIPAPSDNVIIPGILVASRQPIVDALYPPLAAVCNNLTINTGAVLIINSRKALTVSGNLINNGKISIKSDETGTGSLIVTLASSGSGVATAERWMETGKWNLVGSPVPGQTIADFLTKNANVATSGTNRGMGDYNPNTDVWFYSTVGNLVSGKGFCMRTNISSAVTFSGSILSGDQPIPVVADKWNCIGNPYTSAIQIGGAAPDNFLTENGITHANIDPVSGIYVWEKDDSFNGVTGNYTAVSNATGEYQLQAGQAFFVKMNTGVNSVSFKPAMQIHSAELALKSTKGVWPTIKLVASVNNLKSSTVIAFNGSMTKGLDPTYDAALFSGGADLAVYTRLVEDYGIPFAIQALPNDYKSMVIPVGIDVKTGGEVIFSAELKNLSSECKVILEDKETKTFTDLTKGNYKAAIVANSSFSDRFQLHTSDLISKLGNETLVGKLSAYAIRNTEIRVVGEVGNNAIARLYNLQGSVMQIENLKAGNLNVIATANIKNGIYMLSVEDQGKIQTFKLLIRE